MADDCKIKNSKAVISFLVAFIVSLNACLCFLFLLKGRCCRIIAGLFGLFGHVARLFALECFVKKECLRDYYF